MKKRSQILDQLSAGTEVILSSGPAGKKRKLNGKLAVVVKYPRLGSWMHVKLLTPETGLEFSERIKWRKGGFREVMKAARRENPLNLLNDEVWSTVLSFLLHSNTSPSRGIATTDIFSPNYVGRHINFHVKLRSVCRSWKTTIHRILPHLLGLIDANFDALTPYQIIHCIEWMGSFKLQIGSLTFNANLPDIPILIDFLSRCDTRYLTKVRAYLNLGRQNQQSILCSWQKRATAKVNLCDGSIPKQMRIFNAREQKYLHDAIVQHCPSLTDLAVTLTFPQDEENYYDDNVSRALFSMPTITRLKLSIGFTGRVDSCVFAKVIRNLPSLRHLEIGSPGGSGCRRFHIQHSDLEFLNVSGLSKGYFVSCDCPRLQELVCDGSWYSNGTIPRMSWEDCDSFFERCVTNSSLATISIRADRYHFPRLDVPEDCMVTYEDFQRFGKSSSRFMNGYAECLNARYETW